MTDGADPRAPSKPEHFLKPVPQPYINPQRFSAGRGREKALSSSQSIKAAAAAGQAQAIRRRVLYPQAALASPGR